MKYYKVADENTMEIRETKLRIRTISGYKNIAFTQ